MNPYAPPTSEVADPASTEFEYAGFWLRTGAALIDAILIIAITYPILYAIYGEAYFSDDDTKSFIAGPADFLITYVAPALASILFWLGKQGTPGKLLLSMRVVDAQTGKTLSVGQCLGRYLGYIVAMVPLGLGIIWVGIDARKQGWHDKLAKTVVIRAKPSTKSPVVFDGKA
ncbi:MAG: RDD family protein [Rhizobacter sp.]